MAPISNHPELKQMRSVLMSRVTEVMQKAEKLKNHNMDYAYIWTDSRAEYMHYFLTYSRQLTQEVCTLYTLVSCVMRVGSDTFVDPIFQKGLQK